jgi:hypothetical protein
MQAGASQNCTFTVNPLAVQAPAAGATGQMINVDTEDNCLWSATSNSPWISITAGASGNGHGSVRFNVAGNTGAARDGMLVVAGRTVIVSQAGACSYNITVAPRSFRDDGGTAVATVTTAAGCSWTATSNSAWIVVPGGNRSGPGTVSITIQTNSGNARTGTVTVAGETFEIEQRKN